MESGRGEGPWQGKGPEGDVGFLKQLPLRAEFGREHPCSWGLFLLAWMASWTHQEYDSSLGIIRELWGQTDLGTCSSAVHWICHLGKITFQSPHLQSTGNNSYLLKCLLSSREIRAGETVHQKCFPAPHNLTVWLHWIVFTLTAPSMERDLFNGRCGQNWKQEVETLTSCILCFSKVGDSPPSWEIWLETEVALVISHGS